MKYILIENRIGEDDISFCDTQEELLQTVTESGELPNRFTAYQIGEPIKFESSTIIKLSE